MTDEPPATVWAVRVLVALALSALTVAYLHSDTLFVSSGSESGSENVRKEGVVDTCTVPPPDGSWRSETTRLQAYCVDETHTLTHTLHSSVRTLNTSYVWREGLMEELAKEGTPALITNSPADEWEARAWSFDSLEQFLPPTTRFKAKKGVHRRFPLGCCSGVSMSPAQLHSSLASANESLESGAESYVYFSSTVPVDDPRSALSRALSPASVFATPHQPTLTPSAPTSANVWVGSAGSVTPLHLDYSHNVVSMLKGVKRFVLISPDQYRKVYLHPKMHFRARQAQVNLNAIDSEEFPDTRELDVLTVTLREGEVLYIPPMWLHQVTALETSLSANVFSPDSALTFLDKMWEVDPPFDLEDSAVELSCVYQAFAIELCDEITRGDGIDFLEGFVRTRFERLFARGPGLDVPQINDGYLRAYQTDRQRERFTHIDPTFPSHSLCPGNCSDYLERRGGYGRVVDAVAGVMSVLGVEGVPQYAREVYLENYIEDVASMLVGEDRAYELLDTCLRL